MPLLSPIDLEDLQVSGLITPLRPNGTRKIHKRRLHRSSDEENAHLPLLPMPSPESDAFFVIPEEIISLPTLEYLGFNREGALRIWNDWNNPPASNFFRNEAETDSHAMSIQDDKEIVSFIDFVVGHSTPRGQLDTSDDDDELWFDCLRHCRINTDLQMAIMDPAFKKIRLTESCWFWIQDTLSLRYRGLREIQCASREREMDIQRARSRPGGLSGSSSETVAGRRSISATLRQSPRFSPNTAMSQNALTAANTPGTITLYKGIDQARLRGIFNEAGEVQSITPLLSAAGTDLVSRELCLYFAVDRDIAEYYACYAKRRDGAHQVAIVQVTITNSAVKSLSETELQRAYWPSAEWKNLVFHCRRRQKLSSQLRKFKEATLIIGTIAKKPNFIYEKMNSPEEIGEGMILKNKDGRISAQYVFNSDQGEEFFMEHAAPSLQVFPLTTSESEELREWYSKNSE